MRNLARVLSSGFLLLFVAITSYAQHFVETFPSTGELTSVNSNWLPFSAGTAITVASGGLVYPGYEHDNVGNKMVLTKPAGHSMRPFL
jgi:hypothetical protein